MKKLLLLVSILSLLGLKGLPVNETVSIGLSSPGVITCGGRYTLFQEPAANPQILYGFSPYGFSYVPINSRADNIGGNTYQKDESLTVELSNMSLPYGTNVHPGDRMYVSFKTETYMDPGTIEVLGNSIFLPDDVLVSVSQPTLSSTILELDLYQIMTFWSPNNEWLWISWNWGSDPS